MLEQRLLLRHPLLHLHDPLLVIPPTAQGSGMPRRPALAPWCRLVEDGGRVLLEHGGTVVTLEGGAVRTLLPRLLPLLDGTRTVAEIGTALGPAVAPAIDRALALLAEHHVLVDGPRVDDDRPASAAYVAVLGSGPIAREVARQLGLAGIHRVAVRPPEAETAAGSFVIAAPEHTEVQALVQVNARALGRGDPWLQVLPFDGRFGVAGPLYVPGTSGCRACFVTRRAAASGYDEDFDLVERVPRRSPVPAALVTITAGLAAVLAVRWLTTADPTLPGRFYALEASVVVRLRFEQLLRVPRCRSCGGPARAVPSPWFEAVA